MKTKNLLIKQERKLKSQHALEKEWPPVFFGKFTDQNTERFLKKNECAPKGWTHWKIFLKCLNGLGCVCDLIKEQFSETLFWLNGEENPKP